MNLSNSQEIMIIKKAYEYLERVTPLNYDCGKLCRKACCSGEGEIWLLPDEQKLFEGKKGFEIKCLDGEYNLKCSCSCDLNRSIRPFCCRIFPYFPVVKKIGEKLHVELIKDPRGGSFCPLCSQEVDCRRDFQRQIRKAVRLLCTQKKYFDFFVEQGELLSEILQLYEKLKINN